MISQDFFVKYILNISTLGEIKDSQKKLLLTKAMCNSSINPISLIANLLSWVFLYDKNYLWKKSPVRNIIVRNIKAKPWSDRSEPRSSIVSSRSSVLFCGSWVSGSSSWILGSDFQVLNTRAQVPDPGLQTSGLWFRASQ